MTRVSCSSTGIVYWIWIQWVLVKYVGMLYYSNINGICSRIGRALYSPVHVMYWLVMPIWLWMKLCKNCTWTAPVVSPAQRSDYGTAQPPALTSWCLQLFRRIACLRSLSFPLLLTFALFNLVFSSFWTTLIFSYTHSAIPQFIIFCPLTLQRPRAITWKVGCDLIHIRPFCAGSFLALP